ncbi:MAG: acyl-CoA thioester hydrolase [Thermoleophilaceae bacterium]|nr:acyl-CoA thioester hydrolase [Thermoleophilaceae bacterium]
MAEVFRHELRVRYAECDAQGCVFNGNYLMYFDVTMTELWREAIGSYQAMIDAGTDMVVAEARVRYRRPVLFDDLVAIEARVARLGDTSLTTALTVVREGEAAAEGELRHVFVQTGTSEPKSIPADVRAGLAPYLSENEG